MKTVIIGEVSLELSTSLRGAKRRSNPDRIRGNSLDCFASLAMTIILPLLDSIRLQHFHQSLSDDLMALGPPVRAPAAFRIKRRALQACERNRLLPQIGG